MIVAWSCLVGTFVALSLEIPIVATSPAKQAAANEWSNSDTQMGWESIFSDDSGTHLKRNRRFLLPKIPIDIGGGRTKFKFKTTTPKPLPTPPKTMGGIKPIAHVIHAINVAARIARGLGSRSTKSDDEASQEMARCIAILNKILVSEQVRLFKQKSAHNFDNLLSALNRLVFFADKLLNDKRLNDWDEAIRWADAVLSLRDDGVEHILSSLHRMNMGGGAFNVKALINAYISLLPTSDKKFWEKVDAFANKIYEIQEAGYKIWFFAVGYKAKGPSDQKALDEIKRIKKLADKRFIQQDKAGFGPLKLTALRIWPTGRYGLVRVRNTGCPVGSWETGQRHHDTENRNSDNRWSSPLHMDGSWGRNNMDWKFCIKTSPAIAPQWPRGKYCTFARSGCPPGMSKGYIYWDDEDKNNENRFSGTLPDGVYNGNTKIDFCCRTDGNTASEIKLPIEKPFFLFPLNGQACQKVHKMTVREEYFHWDCEDKRNKNGRKWPHPKAPGGKNIDLYMCYYERTSDF